MFVNLTQLKQDKIQLRTRLDNLLSRLCEVLKDLPGVSGIYLLGSLAEGKSDAYSDIDIEVSTTNFPASLAARHSVLQRIGPIEIEWPIAHSTDEWVSTIVFKKESYYHKIDMGLANTSKINDVSDKLRGKVIVIWKGNSTFTSSSTTSTYVHVTEPGTPGHFLVGQLLGAIRYVKARKRGQNLTCWRFASAAVDCLASLLYEQSRGWIELGRKLNTWEYVELDSILNTVEREMLLKALDFSTPMAMDRNLCWILDQMVTLIAIKARATGAIIPDALIQKLLSFIKTDLGFRIARDIKNRKKLARNSP